MTRFRCELPITHQPNANMRKSHLSKRAARVRTRDALVTSRLSEASHASGSTVSNVARATLTQLLQHSDV